MSRTVGSRTRSGLVLIVALLVLNGCDTELKNVRKSTTGPILTGVTDVGAELEQLPPPTSRIDVSVYQFADLTGQQKPNDNFADFSKAVTQGSAGILVDVLQHVSGSRWFSVDEREYLKELLTERNLVDQANTAYRGTKSSTLPPLRLSGMILAGGIVSYDSNLETGGGGAALLGIGVSQKYRRDRVSVVLRAISVKTGQVLTAVQTDKVVYSVLTQGNVFRYVSSDKILQLEAGYSYNEPSGIAVRQAIELAVYSLIVQGAEDGLWSFADHAAQERIIKAFSEGRLARSQEIIVGAK